MVYSSKSNGVNCNGCKMPMSILKMVDLFILILHVKMRFVEHFHDLYKDSPETFIELGVHDIVIGNKLIIEAVV